MRPDVVPQRLDAGGRQAATARDDDDHQHDRPGGHEHNRPRYDHEHDRRASVHRGGTTLFADTFNGLLAGTPWLDDAIVGGWTSVYNGYGLNDVEVDGTNVLAESPQISTSAGQTHAGLVVTTNSFGDFDATVRMKTVQQLRTGSAPNPWEVGWLLWHHTDDTHFYYFVPKPNGWELGKEDPAYPGAQRYLATAPTPTFPVGAWYTVRIREVGSTMTVWVNGTQIASFTDSQRPYASGHLGLYNEDSHVRFDDVTVKAP